MQSAREQEKADNIRYYAYFMSLIINKFWIPACAGMTKMEGGMTGLTYSRIDCFGL